jgi:hypothetical protein
MLNVKDSFDKKQAAFREMQQAMTTAMNRNIKNQISLHRMEVSNEYSSEQCHIKLGDCQDHGITAVLLHLLKIFNRMFHVVKAIITDSGMLNCHS